jgi:hypothetical protein
MEIVFSEAIGIIKVQRKVGMTHFSFGEIILKNH